MHRVTVLTGFRGDARDSPPDFLTSSFQPPDQSHECFGEDFLLCPVLLHSRESSLGSSLLSLPQAARRKVADPGKKGCFLVREPDGDSIVGAEIRECAAQSCVGN